MRGGSDPTLVVESVYYPVHELVLCALHNKATKEKQDLLEQRAAARFQPGAPEQVPLGRPEARVGAQQKDQGRATELAKNPKER